MTETSYPFITNFLVLAVVAGIVFVGYSCVKVIHSLPLQYYHMMPGSNQTDLDRDGIPDYIDDSDGDGVSDEKDPTPYGKDGSLMQLQRLQGARQLLGMQPKIPQTRLEENKLYVLGSLFSGFWGKQEQ